MKVKTLLSTVLLIGIHGFTISCSDSSTSVTLELQENVSVPNSLNVQTNPRQKKIVRGVASQAESSEQVEEPIIDEDENEDSDTYSLDDPNLYEGDNSGVTGLEVIGQINEQIK